MSEFEALTLLHLIQSHLISDGWHIGDGVDDCSGHSEGAMHDSAVELTMKVWTLLKGGE